MFSLFAALAACTDADLDSGSPFVPAAASDTPALRGGGGPKITFEEDALWENCAFLAGDPEEERYHHNEVMPYRGHLVMPWAPEYGRGGLSLFDVSSPCAPEKVGEGFDPLMRETHSMGFVHLREGDPHAGDYVAVTGNLGIQIWDLTDLDDLHVESYLPLEGVFYPDSYSRVILSVFWQYPYVFAAGADNGIYVVDATDPANPVFVTQYSWDPVLRAAGVFVIGNTLLVHSAENSRVAMLDVSDPADPQPIGGGDFDIVDEDGQPREAYHANVAGNWAFFARKEGGGGAMVYDWSDPSTPTKVGDVFSEGGNGGYVFYDEGYAFVGESHWAKIYDMREMDNITEVGTGYLVGDLDTITPYGNVAILSVDDDAENDQASAVMPWTLEPDTTGPEVLRVEPQDGAQGQALTTRIGIGFNEMIEPSSVFAGSVILEDERGQAVDGWGSVTENVASFAPKSLLAPGTTYTLRVLPDGIQDLNGNTVQSAFSSTFRTAGAR